MLSVLECLGDTMDIKKALLFPYKNIGKTLSITVLYLLSMIFYASFVFSDIVFNFLKITSHAAFIAQSLFFAISLFLVIEIFNYFGNVVKDDEHRFFSKENFICGLKILLSILIYSIPYYVISYFYELPGKIYIILLLLILPLIIVKTAKNDSIKAGLDFMNLISIPKKNYLVSLILGAVIISIYSLLSTGLAFLISNFSKDGYILYAATALNFIIYSLLFVIAIETVLSLFSEIDEKKKSKS